MKLKDIFKFDLSTRGGAAKAKQTIDRYIISKDEKKEILNKIKNNSGGEEFDDGMEYYLIMDRSRLENNYMRFPDNISTFSTVISNYANTAKPRIFTKQEPLDVCIAFSVSKYDSNDYDYDFDENKSTKNRFIKSYNSLSLDDNTLFKRITAKEYYSLLKENN